MSNLSSALQKYYSRKGMRVIFSNGQTLNRLALVMWEQLGFRQIDASVLSRVIKGERLFTVVQLKVFCSVLALSVNESEHLSACLRQDYNNRSGSSGSITISSSLSEEVILELTREAFQDFYKADYVPLAKKYNLVQQLASSYILGNNCSDQIGEALGFNLYLRGRTIANGELPTYVVGKLYPIFRQLLRIGKQYHNRTLQGYAYVLLCTGYYLAGGYSDSSGKQKYYGNSIRFARAAIDVLPEDDHESLFALRSMVASASYMHDQETVSYVSQRAMEIIPKQPSENYINALHLSLTISKGLAAAESPNPFAVQDFTANHFKRTIANTGVYEVSAIKEEIDTLLLLKTDDTNYIYSRIKEGLSLASDYGFSRQKKYFNKLLQAP